MSENRRFLLLIEDNPIDTELFKILLTDTDFKDSVLVTAETLEEGINESLANDFDLVLLDLYLPDSAGLEGLGKLRSKSPHVPIIIFSGLDDKKIATKAIQSGAQDYLVKGEYSSKLLDKSMKYAVMRQRLIQERRASENQFLAGQEQERKRIARDIHDGIGQMLVALKFKFASLDCPGEKEQKFLQEIESILENTIEEARRVSENIIPRILAEYGLESALQQLCDEFSLTTGIKVVKSIYGEVNIDENVEITIYRIMQEAFSNMAKYANATKAEIYLSFSQKFVDLQIIDNGVGFDIDMVLRGNGINNIQERVSMLNGIVHYDSRIGEGTRIEINIPVA